MRIVCFSDTHADICIDRLDTISMPEGDVLICAGDFSGIGNNLDIINFNETLKRFKHEFKILCPGNHDRFLEHSYDLGEVILDQAFLLCDQEVVIKGIKFYVTPWTPTFYNWSFMLSEEELKKKFEYIPEDTNVLISHGPPFGILDKNNKGINCGSKALLERVKKVKPKYHVFGHIHQNYGIEEIEDTKFINCSLLDDDYILKNEPVVFDI